MHGTWFLRASESYSSPSRRLSVVKRKDETDDSVNMHAEAAL
jgi:hypothetical protein